MRALLLCAGLAMLTGCGAGETPGAAPSPMPTAAVGGSEAQRAYAAANARMHRGMASINADPDVAFAQGMIPHHEGAVAMARVELRYGKDPELRKLAGQVIAAQEGEIGQLRAWLARKGARTSSSPGPHAGH